MKNKTLKRIMAALTAGMLVVSMSGCGDSSEAETAKPSGDTYTVGIVKYVDDASLNQIEKNIEARLDELAEENGCQFNYTEYDGQADGSTLNQFASQLVSDEVDCIVAIATPTAQIMQSATEGTDIPVIFSAVSDPVGAKLVDSLEAPGANITGTSDALNTEAIMNLILAQNPDIQKVGLLYSKSEDSSAQPIADAIDYMEAKGIEVVEKTGTNNDEVASAADALIAEGVEAVFTPTDNTVMKAELSIYDKFTKAGIPHYTGADSFALNGAFLGFGVDYSELGVLTADMINSVLVEGADPSTTAVETFDNGIATINTETCDALGLDLDELKEAFAPYCESILETTTAEEFDE